MSLETEEKFRAWMESDGITPEHLRRMAIFSDVDRPADQLPLTGLRRALVTLVRAPVRPALPPRSLPPARRLVLVTIQLRDVIDKIVARVTAQSSKPSAAHARPEPSSYVTSPRQPRLHGGTAAEVIKSADDALNRAKQCGGDEIFAFVD